MSRRVASLPTPAARRRHRSPLASQRFPPEKCRRRTRRPFRHNRRLHHTKWRPHRDNRRLHHNVRSPYRNRCRRRRSYLRNRPSHHRKRPSHRQRSLLPLLLRPATPVALRRTPRRSNPRRQAMSGLRPETKTSAVAITTFLTSLALGCNDQQYEHGGNGSDGSGRGCVDGGHVGGREIGG